MKKILFLIQIVLLLNISTLTTNAQVRKPMTFEEYNNMYLIFKGYPSEVIKLDDKTYKVTYQITKLFKGTTDLKQITILASKEQLYHSYPEQQVGEEYSHFFTARYGIGSDELRVGYMFLGCEHNDLACLENYTPEDDKYQRAKFILDNGHKTGYVKNFYYKFNGYKFDGKKRVLQWLPLELEAEGQLKEGQAHGLWKYYDESGKLNNETIYEKGIKVARTSYSENGCSFEFGSHKIKYAYSFDNNNNLITYSKIEYKPDNDSLFQDYLNSEYIEYYSNGKIKKLANSKWIDNKHMKEQKDYDENGNLINPQNKN
ncbi:MAG: hypothetical protein OT643_10770 [Bacteroidetes bacterium]|jgi:antitoxin component YwqK of YwqJK toxin-antitoxin module|nr:hypothetical protein [Chitinophagales bacterium]MDA0199246.1 hypothetical protein [Bacteroidota bacterium]